MPEVSPLYASTEGGCDVLTHQMPGRRMQVFPSRDRRPCTTTSQPTTAA